MKDNMPTVIFTLKQYLAEQASLSERSDAKVNVPTQKELAAIVGLHEVTFGRILNNKSFTINLKVLAPIVTELRRRGLNPTFDDLFSYYE